MLPISRSAQNGLVLAFVVLISEISATPVLHQKPTPVSITPSFVPGVFENTHTSMIGEDGEEVLVPIVGGPDCWFCPEDNEKQEIELGRALLGIDGPLHGANLTKGSWALLGIDGPGTYQPSFVPEFSEQIPVIKVLPNGDPVYSPSRTTDGQATKVKRDEIPTETTYWVSDSFKLLQKYHPVTKWKSVFGKENKLEGGFAMWSKAMEKKYGFKVPLHYGLLAGFVHYHQERHEVGSCEVEKVIVAHSVNWIVRVYNLEIVEGDEAHEAPKKDKGEKLGLDVRIGSNDFLQNFLRTYPDAKFRYLGRISDDATPGYIEERGYALIDEMNKKGGYDWFFNNCRDFVYYLYKRIKQ